MGSIYLLYRLRQTATGLDKLPAWFLRLSAPVICAPLTRLITMSISSGIVPRQWKQASIRPVPKVPAPSGHADFRPISITPVLTRLVEKNFSSQLSLPSFSHNHTLPPLPPVGHIWDVMLVWRTRNINKNCLCATVLCTITMVHKDTISSYRLVDSIGLWSCLI